MSLPILDTSAWREFRGTPTSAGINPTTHLARIADSGGKVRDCFVKLLPLQYPALLGEAIGWLLARSSGIPCAPFAAIVFVPLDELRKSSTLPTEFDGLVSCPAWCCEVVRGKSLTQIHTWGFLLSLAQKSCLRSKDTRGIASFDLWTDLRDRNFGNVIRAKSGGYVAIDHETILHDLLWPPSGKVFHPRSLLLEAKQRLSPADFQRFQVDMANAAKAHAAGLASASGDLTAIIHKIYPAHSPRLIPAALNMLAQRATSGWMANELGVIA